MHKPLVNIDFSLEFHNSFTIADHKDKRFRVIATSNNKQNNKAKHCYDLIKNLDNGKTKSIERYKLKELQPYILD